MTNISKIKAAFPLLLIFIYFGQSSLPAQCPNGKINSLTRCCPRFIDKNNNGVCDLSEVDTNSKFKVLKTDSVSNTSNNLIRRSKPANHIIQPVIPCLQHTKHDTQNSIINKPDTNFKSLSSNQNPVLIKEKVYSRYDLILLSSLTVGFYLLTYILSKTGVIRTCTHRRIWNVVLLLAALLSILIGFVLVILLNYCIRFKYYNSLNLIHVEAGIVLALIVIFHISWHFKYYKNIFKNNNKDKITKC